jgi:hypothetical protein
MDRSAISSETTAIIVRAHNGESPETLAALVQPVHKSLPLREQVRWTTKCFVVIWLFEGGPLGLQPFEVSS